MADDVRFHLDPLCPWCFQTSRWAQHLERLGVVTLRWGVFSLELNAIAAENGLDVAMSTAPDGVMSSAMLRTVVSLRESHGDAAAGAFYAAHGALVHIGGVQDDPLVVVTAALRDAGLPAEIAEAATADPATWKTVVAEHRAVVDAYEAFGVPFIVFDGGDGPGIFGPVVSEPPGTDDAAIGLWEQVVSLTRNPDFAELKRAQRRDPDLASVRNWRASQ